MTDKQITSLEQLPQTKIPLYGSCGMGRFAIVDGDFDGDYFSEYKWYVNPQTGLIYRQDYDNGESTTIMLHQEVARAPKGMWIRHINSNKFDNRSCNLRWITPSYSAITRARPKKRGIRNFKGVTHPRSKTAEGKIWQGKRWQAIFRGKYLGTFDLEEDAACAYDVAAKDYYGSLAQLNFPNN
jgi:hypothetical protein